MSQNLPALRAFKAELEVIAPELPTSNAIPVEKMKSAIMVAVQKTPRLLDADRSTLWQSARMCAADGLVPDGREAAFVLFKTKQGDSWVDAVQYIPMVYGLRKRALMSGEVTDIRAYLVWQGEWENDRFKMIAGDEESIEHRPIIAGAPGEPERGDLIGGYAIAVLKTGERIRHWMPLVDIEKRRRSAPSQRIYEKGKTPRVSDTPLGVWLDWYEDQCLKTVVRGIAKKLPLSSDDMRAIMESDHDFDGAPITRAQEHRPTLADRLRAAQNPAPQSDGVPPPSDVEGERGPAGDEASPAGIDDAEVIEEPPFDESNVFPASKEFTEGEVARLQSFDEGSNPYRENPAFSSWLGGYRKRAQG